jgi:hypothetical protein
MFKCGKFNYVYFEKWWKNPLKSLFFVFLIFFIKTSLNCKILPWKIALVHIELVWKSKLDWLAFSFSKLKKSNLKYDFKDFT